MLKVSYRCSYYVVRRLLPLVAVAVPLLLSGCSTDEPHNRNSESASVKVLEYCPAMGQFVNLLPPYSEGDTYADICHKAEVSLSSGGIITLGGFGGYVTMSLGQHIENRPGERDFCIRGNAFLQQGSEEYGNSEPGIVLVSVDENNNGLPDDEWYELAGSEYYKPETRHHYRKVWHKNDSTLNNPYHTQPYFPQWLSDSVIVADGTCLASHKDNVQGMIVQRVLDYGYVDNRPNTDTLGIAFDLDWAVDDNGEKVSLTYCDFVRVQTAVDEVNTGIGELSTEVGNIFIFE